MTNLPSLTPTSDPVKIYASNQKGYIWDVRDIQTVRVRHHICGMLSGTLPQVGQQNVFLGIPLILLPEEVVVLVKNSLAVIIDDTRAHRTPTQSEALHYSEQRAQAIETQRLQTRAYDEAKKLKMAQVYKEQIEKKRQGKMKAAEDQSSRIGSGKRNEEDEQIVASFRVDVPDLPNEKRGSQRKEEEERPLESIPYTIIIQTSSTDLSWHDPSLATYPTLAEANEAGCYVYPTTPVEAARCRVFEDLWKKGYFMGGGLRFGGDFLVYPGDPLRYHSHFTLTVISSLETSIMPLDLVSYGRLATAVKKAHLLASYDDKEDRVEYLSLEWAAMG